MKPSFAIVGCGKVGTTLGKFLYEKGYPVAGLASKHIASAKKAADIIGVNCFSDNNREATQNADMVFITTPDDVIQETCSGISLKDGFKKNAIVFHCSGSLPSTVLNSAKYCGATVASLHPLQSIASAEYPLNPFQDIIVTVEGESEAIKTARRIVTDLGATFIMIATEGKIFYHAAAVAASNYLVTLVDLAFKLIDKAGIAGEDALQVLKPLIMGTLVNIEKVGIPEALTGPIARGDVKTIEDHVSAIESVSPELLNLYKNIGLHTIGIATAKGTLSETSARTLKNILMPIGRHK